MRREASRLAAIMLGFAFILGVLRGGSHYLYCPFMNEVVTEHCCATPQDGASTIEAPDCCQANTIGTLPSAASVTEPPVVPVAPRVAVLPAVLPLGNDASLAPPTRLGFEPTGPPPRSPAERTAHLMVFLI